MWAKKNTFLEFWPWDELFFLSDSAKDSRAWVKNTKLFVWWTSLTLTIQKTKYQDIDRLYLRYIFCIWSWTINMLCIYICICTHLWTYLYLTSHRYETLDIPTAWEICHILNSAFNYHPNDQFHQRHLYVLYTSI